MIFLLANWQNKLDSSETYLKQSRNIWLIHVHFELLQPLSHGYTAVAWITPVSINRTDNSTRRVGHKTLNDGLKTSHYSVLWLQGWSATSKAIVEHIRGTLCPWPPHVTACSDTRPKCLRPMTLAMMAFKTGHMHTLVAAPSHSRTNGQKTHTRASTLGQHQGDGLPDFTLQSAKICGASLHDSALNCYFWQSSADEDCGKK